MQDTHVQIFRKYVWRYIGMAACLLCVIGAQHARAELTPQSMSGTVEVLLAGEQTWAPLTAATRLKSGDQVRTGPDGVVDLWFEDGSVLHVAEDTQLAVSELELSTAEKTRIGRFKLAWGAVTAKVTKLVYDTSVVEVETSTVLAGVKFSEMTVEAPKANSRSDVTALQGTIVTRKIGEGVVNIVGRIDDQEGVAFPLDAVGTEVTIGIQQILRKITIESEFPIQFLRTMIGGNDNIVKIDNVHGEALEVNYNDISAVLGQNTAATLGIPPTDELTVSAQHMNASFLFKQRAIPKCDALYFHVDKGPVKINGKRYNTNEFDCITEAGAQQKAPARTLVAPPAQPLGEEVPVAPPAPEPEAPSGADDDDDDDDDDIEPTPTPSGQPTGQPTTPPSGTRDTLTPPGEDVEADEEEEVEEEEDDEDDDDDDDDDDVVVPPTPTRPAPPPPTPSPASPINP